MFIKYSKIINSNIVELVTMLLSYFEQLKKQAAVIAADAAAEEEKEFLAWISTVSSKYEEEYDLLDASLRDAIYCWSEELTPQYESLQDAIYCRTEEQAMTRFISRNDIYSGIVNRCVDLKTKLQMTKLLAIAKKLDKDIDIHIYVSSMNRSLVPTSIIASNDCVFVHTDKILSHAVQSKSRGAIQIAGDKTTSYSADDLGDLLITDVLGYRIYNNRTGKEICKHYGTACA